MGFLLKDNLENYGFVVTHCDDGQLALAEFHTNTYDLCLLDVMMPNMDGYSLASKIRTYDLDIPIFFLTAKSMKEDRIKGFKLGADDYVTKPFSIEEVVLRIKAILKRGKSTQPIKKLLSFSKYVLELNNLILKVGDKEIQLTQREADVLALFISNPNVLLRREFILDTIWKDDNYFVGRSLDVFVSKLRKHFKDDESITIRNIHGTGYKFQIREDDQPSTD